MLASRSKASRAWVMGGQKWQKEIKEMWVRCQRWVAQVDEKMGEEAPYPVSIASSFLGQFLSHTLLGPVQPMSLSQHYPKHARIAPKSLC